LIAPLRYIPPADLQAIATVMDRKFEFPAGCS